MVEHGLLKRGQSFPFYWCTFLRYNDRTVNVRLLGVSLGASQCWQLLYMGLLILGLALILQHSSCYSQLYHGDKPETIGKAMYNFLPSY